MHKGKQYRFITAFIDNNKFLTDVPNQKRRAIGQAYSVREIFDTFEGDKKTKNTPSWNV